MTLTCFWIYVAGEQPQEYDYKLDLKDDVIKVTNDKGEIFIVQPDSLDEFIIKDNL